MVSRDVWKHGSSQHLQDALASALLSLLLPGSEGPPVYFASPWMSDFALLENTSREVADLFPELEEQGKIRFLEYLRALGARHDVRLITSQNPTSDGFVERLRHLAPAGGGSLRVRLSPEERHEKGILAPGFYIDGSMNITHRGVHVNGEKIAYHAASDAPGSARVAAAYLEFNRHWDLLAHDALRR